MTMKLFNTGSVQDIANAIRARNGLSRTYKIAEMASAVSAIATDGTATADKILSGYTAYGLSGQKMVGTASDSGGTAIVVTDEPDEHGGTIRYINGVSLDGDTVSAETLFSGVTAHNNLGSSIVGTYVPPVLSTLSVTPTEVEQTFPSGDVVETIYLYEHEGYSSISVDLSTFNDGDTVTIGGTLAHSPDGVTISEYVDVSGSFTWNGSGISSYQKNGYTFIFLNASTVMIQYIGSYADYIYAGTTKYGNNRIGIEAATASIDGYSQVTVAGISSTYVGSGVSRMSSSNLTFATGTGVFTAPSGYYSTNATYTLTPKTSTNIAFNSGTGVFTVSSGYYSSSPTLTLSTKAGTTITPSSTSQIAISSGYFATGSIYVASASGGDYYSWYKALADRYTTIPLSLYSSDTFNAYSRVNAYQFAFAQLIGSATFENVSSIGSWGFSSAWRAKTTGVSNYVNLPNCSKIESGAFYGATLDAVSIPLITSIPSSAFCLCTYLSSVTTGAITSIGSSAFSGCRGLIEHPNLENCASIGTNAFQHCDKLTYLSAPNLSILPSSICYGCYSLSWIYAPSCEYVYNYAFYNCSSLLSVSLSKCINISTYAFSSCSSLLSVSLPMVSILGYGAFGFCSALTSIDLPVCSSIGQYAFKNCINLSIVILRDAKSFGTNSFDSCYNLLSLYILGSSIASFGGGMFSSTPISNYTTSTGGVYGSIYVPASLYNTYINHTSWKTYSARFVSLTDAQIALI